MTADYTTAIAGLQENLIRLDGDMSPVPFALWNLSNALLVVCDALQNLEKRMKHLETLQTQDK